MGLSRRRDASIIWPGFVDAVTTLVMVLMFVLTIFTVLQSVLQETITTQDGELNSLTDQVAALADALGLERNRVGQLQAEVGTLRSDLAASKAEGERQAALVAGLAGRLATAETELQAAEARVASFEAQVATLLAERDAARGEVADLSVSNAELEAARAALLTERDALQLAVARARQEIDQTAEEARLAAARREAVEALIADLQAKSTADAAALTAAQTELSEAEAARLVDAAALEALRARMAGSDEAMAAMTLALEEQRKRAEETLLLLAAAQTEAAQAAADVDQSAALLAAAERALTDEQAKAIEAAQRVALLNEQIVALRGQLGSLQAVLNEARDKDATAQVQLEALGSQLNTALAQVAAEQKRRAALEEAERLRLEAENADLEKFRSEFFGQLSRLLEGREGVRVVGDRFVFSSEVLFQPGAADLAPEGRAQIAGVVEILNEVRAEIPDTIDWIIRVDGHTDNVPLSGAGAFADNWELSQARALSVVRFMQNSLGFPPDRLAATGFGEYRPVVSGNTEAARQQNRRIELKLTER
ncbi:peptidoglycan -binding protein [Pseudotabrizicola alkalilacus]|uniref:Peptidoglycan-binding protein n=1 Tax=Pseudotabrizicola alkalilacus TaxID=2305252 RepID=A0A411Z7J9_9RHOB|nr:peptidoglycan -binding protein [Pseudotabrizicola alkalilacus]RGP39118.1 peptidoglycan -binding protein [Pseudotabrizicola alkalilacus]